MASRRFVFRDHLIAIEGLIILVGGLLAALVITSLMTVDGNATASSSASSARSSSSANERDSMSRRRSTRDLATKAGLSLGGAVNARVLASGGAQYRSAAAKNFNMLTTEGEMRWAYTEPERGVFDFSAAESVVAFARKHQMEVRGHNLLWFDENPAWLEQGSFTRSQLLKILRRHVLTVVSHFRGRVAQWDVVNEPLDDAGNLRDSVWLRGIGPSYIAKAFRWAHRADPHAELFINDFGIEVSGPKLAGMVSLVRSLRRNNVPVDGVGFQGHFGLGGVISSTTASELKHSMTRFRKMHVATAVTELDVALPVPPTPADLAAQARVFGRALRACLHTRSCDTLVVWGIGDSHSWVPDVSPGQGAALLFDTSFQPKPAYQKLRRILSRARRH